MRYSLLLTSALAAWLELAALAQMSGPIMDKSLSQIEVNRDRMAWASPESVLNGLRSSDEKARLAAFHSMGFADREIYQQLWSQGTPATVIGKRLLLPGQVRLDYAALGETGEKQAILSAFIADAQIAALAVAVPTEHGWTRVAFFDCWCKYDMGPDPLSELVQIQSAPWDSRWPEPRPFELVVRASGGGTGLYTQTEARFRVQRGELVEVALFTRRHRNCGTRDPDGKFRCSMEQRWFHTTDLQQGPGAVLVSAQGKYASEGQPKAFWDLWELQVQELHTIQCRSYLWDRRAFRYKEVSEATSLCTPVKAQ